LLTTSAASLHQLGAAAAFAGSARHAPTDGNGRLRRDWGSRHLALANALMSGGWIVEQHTIRKNRDLDPVTNDAVRTKDLCVAGALVTTIAIVVVGLMARRAFPAGVVVDAAGDPPPGTPRAAERYQRSLKLLRVLNRAFVAGAIAFTPFVNFDILESYRPGTLYRLFT
jgi:hypothetical protein